jgi:hypothetical protein
MARKHPTKKWPFKFVEVVWRDIVSCSEWRSTNKPPACVTVHHRGWLIWDEDEWITLAGSLTERDAEDKQIDPDDIYDMGDSTTIPRGTIVSIREVK